MWLPALRIDVGILAAAMLRSAYALLPAASARIRVHTVRLKIIKLILAGYTSIVGVLDQIRHRDHDRHLLCLPIAAHSALHTLVHNRLTD